MLQYGYSLTYATYVACHFVDFMAANNCLWDLIKQCVVMQLHVLFLIICIHSLACMQLMHNIHNYQVKHLSLHVVQPLLGTH